MFTRLTVQALAAVVASAVGAPAALGQGAYDPGQTTWDQASADLPFGVFAPPAPSPAWAVM